MSNQAYILYLQSIIAANTQKQTSNGFTVAGMQASIDNFTAQIASTQAAIDAINADTNQLTADNTLTAMLIQQLQAGK